MTGGGSSSQLSTAQFKFGTASLLTDGNADAVSNTVPSIDFAVGTGAFTIDFWAQTVTHKNYSCYCSMGGSNTASGSIGAGADGKLFYYALGWRIQDTVAMTAGVWYHIALVGNGGEDGSRNIKMYKNGVQVGSTYTVNYNWTIETIWIACNQSKSSECLAGYTDEFRWSKGIQRWTTTFDIPTVAYPRVFQDYSESIMITQGSYSLKSVALAIDSLNKTLTRTVSPTISLLDEKTISFDIRSSRTGSNIKIGIHNGNGITTEIIPNILVADIFQTIVWNISGIASVDKNAIDQIIITIVNADVENTFYIDNMYAILDRSVRFI